MHELSIAMSIIDIATSYAKKAKAKKVTSVEIEIGTLSGIVFDSLKFALEMASRNTILEKTDFELISIQARAECKTCGTTFDMENFFVACPACNSYGNKITQGKEMKVKALNVD